MSESIVLPLTQWDAVAALLLEPGRVCVGRARVIRTATGCEYLPASLRQRAEWPVASSEPPICERVLWVAPGEGLSDVRALARRLQPLPTQTWVLASVGLGEDRNGWCGAVLERGELRPLDEIRVVGPGMLRLQRESRADAFTEHAERESEQRWSRTAGALGADAVRKLRETRVLLMGAGRNGSQVAFQLAALGVERLYVFDPDTLGMENLDAMPGLTAADARRKRSKATALIRRLRAFRPDMQLHAVTSSVADSACLRAARNVDVIFSCVDHDLPRLAAASLANRYCRIHIDVATSIRETDGERVLAGDVRTMLPGQGCVCCVGGLPDEAAARRELFAPPGMLKLESEPRWNDLRLGSLVTLNSMACGIGVQTYVDLMTGRLESSLWQRIRWHEGQGLQSDAALVERHGRCSVCETR